MFNVSPYDCDATLTQGLRIEERWPGWTAIPHTAFMLAEMKGLKHLRLIVKRIQMYEPLRTCDFTTLTAHPVHAYLRPKLPQTNLSVVNFIQSSPAFRVSHEKFSLESTFYH